LDHARLYADLTQENNDRRKAEEALRASEERWSNLAENSSAGIAPYTERSAEKQGGIADGVRRRSPSGNGRPSTATAGGSEPDPEAIEAMSTAEGRERDLLISTRLGEGDEVRVAGSPIFDLSLLGVRLEGSAVKIAEAAKP
jgi:PAS domain-containing protein